MAADKGFYAVRHRRSAAANSLVSARGAFRGRLRGVGGTTACCAAFRAYRVFP